MRQVPERRAGVGPGRTQEPGLLDVHRTPLRHRNQLDPRPQLLWTPMLSVDRHRFEGAAHQGTEEFTGQRDGLVKQLPQHEYAKFSTLRWESHPMDYLVPKNKQFKKLQLQLLLLRKDELQHKPREHTYTHTSSKENP